MRRTPHVKSKYSPSYYAELVDPRHLTPGWARWLIGLMAVIVIMSLPLLFLALAFGTLRFIWITIRVLFGI